MIAGLATHADLMARDGPYVLGGREVRIVDEQTFTVREPTPHERLVLDAHFLHNPTLLLNTIKQIGQAEVFGMGDAVLSYLVAADDRSRMLLPDTMTIP